MTERQLRRLAKRLLEDIARTQKRNEAARVSASKRRRQQLEDMGIKPEALPLCDLCSL